MSWRSMFSRHMEQVSFHFCAKSEHSSAVRQFLTNNIRDLEILNPKFRFLVREANDLKPYIVAQYFVGTGEQRYFKYNVEGLGESQILSLMEKIAKAGAERTRLYPDNPKQQIPFDDIIQADKDE